MWWALPTAQVVSLCFNLVEREFSTKWKLLSQSSTFFTPSLSKEYEEGKNDISGQKRKKILWHLAMFAENDGGFYCAKPQIFWTFTEAWKHFWKKLKSLPKKKLVCYWFFSLGLCTLDVLIFQISLTPSCLPQTQLVVRFKEKNPQRESAGLGVAQGGALLQWLICSQWFGVFLLQKETQWINALWKLESEIFRNHSRVIILPYKVHEISD